jgi:CNT family concentrative nucleoside transporter
MSKDIDILVFDIQDICATIIFFSAFISILYYFGIMQFIVELFVRVMVKTMDTSGAETLCRSANIFE